MRAHHVAIVTPDLERLRRFYGGDLGLPEVGGFPSSPSAIASRAAEPVAGTVAPPVDSSPSMWIPALWMPYV